jgi:hypothetical protein
MRAYGLTQLGYRRQLQQVLATLDARPVKTAIGSPRTGACDLD